MAEGTQERVQKLIHEFEQGKVQVFYGEYTGTDPADKSDTIDLREEYFENENASAPAFHYVLDGVITTE